MTLLYSSYWNCYVSLDHMFPTQFVCFSQIQQKQKNSRSKHHINLTSLQIQHNCKNNITQTQFTAESHTQRFRYVTKTKSNIINNRPLLLSPGYRTFHYSVLFLLILFVFLFCHYWLDLRIFLFFFLLSSYSSLFFCLFFLFLLYSMSLYFSCVLFSFIYLVSYSLLFILFS